MPYKDKEKQRQANRERMQRVRGNTEKVTQEDSVLPDKEEFVLPLFPPSKFLSPEQDRMVQENVINTLKAMTGSRRQAFRAMSNTFIPNAVKDPTLSKPEL